jgi:putative FmdB family regulatory protein
MPLYEYLCSRCQSLFEKYVRTWDEAVTCPSCQAETVQKQLSTFAFAATGAGPGASGGCGCGRGGCGCH